MVSGHGPEKPPVVAGSPPFVPKRGFDRTRPTTCLDTHLFVSGPTCLHREREREQYLIDCMFYLLPSLLHGLIRHGVGVAQFPPQRAGRIFLMCSLLLSWITTSSRALGRSQPICSRRQTRLVGHATHGRRSRRWSSGQRQQPASFKFPFRALAIGGVASQGNPIRSVARNAQGRGQRQLETDGS